MLVGVAVGVAVGVSVEVGDGVAVLVGEGVRLIVGVMVATLGTYKLCPLMINVDEPMQLAACRIGTVV